MVKHTLVCSFFGVMLAASSGVISAHAITAEELMTNMEKGERSSYIVASIEMAAAMFHLQGEREKSSCIMEWFFESGDGPDQIVQALHRFSDRSPQTVMIALINRRCPAD